MEDLDQLEYKLYDLKFETDWFLSLDTVKLYGVQIINTDHDSTQYEGILLNKLKENISTYTLSLGLETLDIKNGDLGSFLEAMARTHIEIYNIEVLSDSCIRFWTPGYWDPSVYDFELTNVY